MATEIRVPTLGESVSEATIGKWFKKVGEAIAVDEPLVELETDKVTIEVPAAAAGSLAEITAKEGDTVEVGALLGMIGSGDGAGAAPAKTAEPAAGRRCPGIRSGGCSHHRRGCGKDRRSCRRTGYRRTQTKRNAGFPGSFEASG